MSEDGEQDTIHGGPVLEDAHGTGAAADFAEAAFDGVDGAHALALFGGFVAEAGEQVIEVGAQAAGRLGILGFPAIGEAARVWGRVVAFMMACRARLTAAWSACRTLFRTFRILCAQQRWTGMPG